MTVPSPTTVRQAAVLVALEGLAGLVAAVVYLVSGFGGSDEPGLNKFGTAAWFAIIGGSVLAAEHVFEQRVARIAQQQAVAEARDGAIKLGGEAAYKFDQFEPYVPLTFEYQTTKPEDNTGRFALIVGAGLRYQWSDMLRAGILATATELQTHYREVKIEANLRWTF